MTNVYISPEINLFIVVWARPFSSESFQKVYRAEPVSTSTICQVLLVFFILNASLWMKCTELVCYQWTNTFASKVLTLHMGDLLCKVEKLQAVIIFSYLPKSCSQTEKSTYAPEVGSCGPEVFVLTATIQVSLHQAWLWSPNRMYRSPVPFGSWLWQTTLCFSQETVCEKGCGNKVQF